MPEIEGGTSIIQRQRNMSKSTRLETSDIEHALKIIAKEEEAEEETFVTARELQGVLSFELDKNFTTSTIRNHGFSQHGHLPRKYDSIEFLYGLRSGNPTGVQTFKFNPKELLEEIESNRPALFQEE